MGEVGTFGTILLVVSFLLVAFSETCLPISIEIEAHLIKTEQKISWQFFGDTVYSYDSTIQNKS